MLNKELNNPSRSELITDFVKTNPEYYIEKFQQIGSKPTFSFSFNLYAAILGPIWFGMRNIWNWALAFLIIETFSVVQIIRGLFGNITADAVQKIEQVQSTIAFRNKQLEAAITNNPLINWTTAKVSIIKNVRAQFQIFRIPNQIGPKIAAYKLNEKENVGLLPIF